MKYRQLSILYIPSLLFGFDIIALGMLIPYFSETFNISIPIAQLFISLNSFILALSLIPAGKLCDFIGDKNTIITGLILVSLSSILIIIESQFYTILFIRIFMAIGNGLVLIGTLSLIHNKTTKNMKAKLIAYWSFFAGLGMIIAPLLTPILVDATHWKSIFFITSLTAIITALLLKLTPSIYNQTTIVKTTKVNNLLYLTVFFWAIISLIVLASLKLGFILINTYFIIIILFIVTIFLTVFLYKIVKKYTKDYPISYFIAIFIGSFGYFAGGVSIASCSLCFWMISIDGYSLNKTSTIMLAFTLAYTLSPIISAKFLRYLSIKQFVYIGLSLLLFGMVSFFILSTIKSSAYYYMISYVFLGSGCGLVNPYSAALALEKIGHLTTGGASGMLLTCKWLSSAMGVAITSIIWTSFSNPILPLLVMFIFLFCISIYLLKKLS
ncbi:MAG: MFS transporter [Gammaproteobacteria bacterium]|nr:MAG: MFS transporter [Gammaproteobacteria bacterium]UTW41888.1 MFS transporter [bacterium SCSIO 12844]